MSKKRNPYVDDEADEERPKKKSKKSIFDDESEGEELEDFDIENLKEGENKGSDGEAELDYKHGAGLTQNIPSGGIHPAPGEIDSSGLPEGKEALDPQDDEPEALVSKDYSKSVPEDLNDLDQKIYTAAINAKTADELRIHVETLLSGRLLTAERKEFQKFQKHPDLFKDLKKEFEEEGVDADIVLETFFYDVDKQIDVARITNAIIGTAGELRKLMVNSLSRIPYILRKFTSVVTKGPKPHVGTADALVKYLRGQLTDIAKIIITSKRIIEEKKGQISVAEVRAIRDTNLRVATQLMDRAYYLEMIGVSKQLQKACEALSKWIISSLPIIDHFGGDKKTVGLAQLEDDEAEMLGADTEALAQLSAAIITSDNKMESKILPLGGKGPAFGTLNEFIPQEKEAYDALVREFVAANVALPIKEEEKDDIQMPAIPEEKEEDDLEEALDADLDDILEDVKKPDSKDEDQKASLGDVKASLEHVKASLEDVKKKKKKTQEDEWDIPGIDPEPPEPPHKKRKLPSVIVLKETKEDKKKAAISKGAHTELVQWRKKWEKQWEGLQKELAEEQRKVREGGKLPNIEKLIALCKENLRACKAEMHMIPVDRIIPKVKRDADYATLRHGDARFSKISEKIQQDLHALRSQKEGKGEEKKERKEEKKEGKEEEKKERPEQYDIKALLKEAQNYAANLKEFRKFGVMTNEERAAQIRAGIHLLIKVEALNNDADDEDYIETMKILVPWIFRLDIERAKDGFPFMTTFDPTADDIYGKSIRRTLEPSGNLNTIIRLYNKLKHNKVATIETRFNLPPHARRRGGRGARIVTAPRGAYSGGTKKKKGYEFI